MNIKKKGGGGCEGGMQKQEEKGKNSIKELKGLAHKTNK